MTGARAHHLPQTPDEERHSGLIFAFVAGSVALVGLTVLFTVGLATRDSAGAPRSQDSGTPAPISTGTTVLPQTGRERAAATAQAATAARKAAVAAAAKQAKKAKKARARLTRQTGQADALVTIIERSGTARDKVSTGVRLVDSCEDPDQGTGLLQDAVGIRSEVLARLDEVDVALLPQGADAVAALKAAQLDSLRADQGYEAWAENAVHNCSFTNTAYQDENYHHGQDASRDAQTSKSRFARYWKPIAELTGVRSFTAADI